MVPLWVGMGPTGAWFSPPPAAPMASTVSIPSYTWPKTVSV